MCLILGGCATTDQAMTDKERAKLDREAQKANRQNSQEMNKAMRGTGQGTSQPRQLR
jgi:hypothetical protein